MPLLRFDAFMDGALYGPGGFYESGRGAGKTRDFLTSPEVGSLFGAVLARRLDRHWRLCGEPEQFRVVEIGAGPATLCRTVFAAEPACQQALRYDLVDRAAGMRALHQADLPVDQVRSLAALPTDVAVHAIISNEVLDNVAFRLMQWGQDQTSVSQEDAWNEVYISMDDESSSSPFEILRPVGSSEQAQLNELVPDPQPGSRVPLQHDAASLVDELRGLCPDGLVILIDYARSTTAEFASIPSANWLRTYDRHRKGQLGVGTPELTDITCDVALDQILFGQEIPIVRPQHEALMEWGLEAVLAESALKWEARRSDYDLKALRARSHSSEAPILLDPDGLGGFSVLEWGPE